VAGRIPGDFHLQQPTRHVGKREALRLSALCAPIDHADREDLHPFPILTAKLRSSKAQNGVHVAHIDSFWLSMWIADIVRSAQKIRSLSLLEELDVLCDVLETAEQNNARMRGVPLE